jgi:CRISPR-associated protein Cas1
LRLYGFDVYKGFYHKLFFNRKSLASDIMEPFRCVIDKALLKAFNLKQINEKDFKIVDGRYVLE